MNNLFQSSVSHGDYFAAASKAAEFMCGNSGFHEVETHLPPRGLQL
jgi:hypothetical protein